MVVVEVKSDMMRAIELHMSVSFAQQPNSKQWWVSIPACSLLAAPTLYSSKRFPLSESCTPRLVTYYLNILTP